MPQKIELRDLLLPATIFTVSVILTLIMGIYFRTVIYSNIDGRLRESAETMTKILDNTINDYRLNYYGIQQFAREIFVKSGEASLTNKAFSDAFGRTENVAFISYSTSDTPNIYVLGNRYNSDVFRSGIDKELSSDKFKTALDYAFKTNAAVFYVSKDTFSQSYLSSIIPIDNTTKAFYIINIAFSDILSPILKGGLNDVDSKILITIKSDGQTVFKSEPEEASVSMVKKQKRNAEQSQRVELTNNSIDIEYSELRHSSLNNVLRKIPFIITISGIFISVFAFGLILSVIVSTKYKKIS